jgi:hypothetical protein
LSEPYKGAAEIETLSSTPDTLSVMVLKMESDPDNFRTTQEDRVSEQDSAIEESWGALLAGRLAARSSAERQSRLLRMSEIRDLHLSGARSAVLSDPVKIARGRKRLLERADESEEEEMASGLKCSRLVQGSAQLDYFQDDIIYLCTVRPSTAHLTQSLLTKCTLPLVRYVAQ